MVEPTARQMGVTKQQLTRQKKKAWTKEKEESGAETSSQHCVERNGGNSQPQMKEMYKESSVIKIFGVGRAGTCRPFLGGLLVVAWGGRGWGSGVRGLGFKEWEDESGVGGGARDGKKAVELFGPFLFPMAVPREPGSTWCFTPPFSVGMIQR